MSLTPATRFDMAILNVFIFFFIGCMFWAARELHRDLIRVAVAGEKANTLTEQAAQKAKMQDVKELFTNAPANPSALDRANVINDANPPKNLADVAKTVGSPVPTEKPLIQELREQRATPKK